MKKLIEHYKNNLIGLGAILASLLLGTVTALAGGPVGMIIFFYALTPVIVIGDLLSLR